MLPKLLTITNYCQITHLSVDFTKANFFSITAPNGSGKSNVLNALRFAMTGVSSPGAVSLSEDIKDGEQSAEVTLTFDLGGHTQGMIERKISVSGNNKVKLTLTSGDKTEILIKSKDAEKRFQEILGVPPKLICDVIIAPQREIEALLFWPVNQRVPKFQKFLHGQLFAEIDRLIGEEKASLAFDHLAKDRLKVLEQSLRETSALVNKIKSNLSALNVKLSNKKYIQAKEKQPKVELFAKLKAKKQELSHNKTSLTTESSELNKQLISFGKDFDTVVIQQRNKINEFRKQWEAFRPSQQAKVNCVQLEKEKQSLDRELVEFKNQITQFQNLQDKLGTIEELTELLRLKREEEAHSTKIKEIERSLNEMRTSASVNEKYLKQLSEETLSNEMESLLTSTELDHIEGHNKADCLICKKELSKQDVAAIEERNKRANKVLEPIRREAEELTNKLDTLRKSIMRLEGEKELIETVVKKSIAQMHKLNLKDAVFKLSVTDLQKTIRDNASIVETGKKACGAIAPMTTRIGVIDLRLKELSKVILSGAKCPQVNEEELSLLCEDQEIKERQLTAYKELKSKIDVAQSKLIIFDGQIAEVELEATNSSLPSLNKEFILLDGEKALLEQGISIEQEVAGLNIELAGKGGMVNSITTQIEATRAEIAGFEDTKKYMDELVGLEKLFSYSGIPSQIVRRQLNALCSKMEGIIRDFHLANQFSIRVDEDLEIYMVYPGGFERRIHKASGGERMILGVAFRLATHQFLAPEMPFLAIDEPSNHLDEENIHVLQELFRSLRNQLDKYKIEKFVYCTHSRALASEAEVIINL